MKHVGLLILGCGTQREHECESWECRQEREANPTHRRGRSGCQAPAEPLLRPSAQERNPRDLCRVSVAIASQRLAWLLSPRLTSQW